MTPYPTHCKLIPKGRRQGIPRKERLQPFNPLGLLNQYRQATSTPTSPTNKNPASSVPAFPLAQLHPLYPLPDPTSLNNDKRHPPPLPSAFHPYAPRAARHGYMAQTTFP